MPVNRRNTTTTQSTERLDWPTSCWAGAPNNWSKKRVQKKTKAANIITNAINSTPGKAGWPDMPTKQQTLTQWGKFVSNVLFLRPLKIRNRNNM